MIVFTHEHSSSPAVHPMANQRGRRKIPNPPFIHATTILYHFAPLSTTCMFIIVQKEGNDKDFLRFSFKITTKKLQKSSSAALKFFRYF
jgi:hypothetical protein